MWRVPGMMSDGHDRVFMIGDWWTVAGDLGTLRYTYSNGVESYQQLPRGQFFAVANIASPAAPALLASLTLSPTSVHGGATTTANRVVLNAPAPPGGYAVTLSSSVPAVAAVPASVVVPEGATTSPDFSITTQAVSVGTLVTITASGGGATRTAGLTVSPLEISSVTLSPPALTTGAAGALNLVRLNGPAPPAGATVALSSSNPTVAAVPATVIVPAGTDTSPSFAINAGPVTVTTAVTITATYATDSGWTTAKSASVTVSPSQSSDGTTVPPAVEIIDGDGAVWTMNGAAILRNGASAGGGSGVKMLWSGGSIYVLGSTGGSWWKWLGTGWSNVGPAQPGATVPPPPPPPTGPTSPDGTVVPPATEIVDALGAVWTMNGAAILRNGVSAGGGSGVTMLWSGGSIYVLGSTGGSWWKWTGSGWSNVGPTQPGACAASAAAAANRPHVSGWDGGATGAADHRRARRGVDDERRGDSPQRRRPRGAAGVTMLWSGGSIYVLGSTGGSWWKWLGTGWSNVGPTHPGGTVPPPAPPPPTGPTSPDGTVVPPAPQIIDALGAVWTMNGAAILRNGISAGGGSGVKMLWSGGSIYVLGSTGGSWWKWSGTGWTNVGQTHPGPTVPPPPPPPPGASSPDGAAVPPATQIVDAVGAVWTLSGEVVLRNGAAAAGGTGFRILWWGGTIYVLGSDNTRWWRWTGTGWAYFGTGPPV